MREFKKHVLGEIRSMRKSIEDLEVTVKENKNEIKSLMDRKKKTVQNMILNHFGKLLTENSLKIVLSIVFL